MAEKCKTETQQLQNNVHETLLQSLKQILKHSKKNKMETDEFAQSDAEASAKIRNEFRSSLRGRAAVRPGFDTVQLLKHQTAQEAECRVREEVCFAFNLFFPPNTPAISASCPAETEGQTPRRT